MAKKPLIPDAINDTVVMEGRETFSAWPITFGNTPDPAGLTFSRKTQLQPPFDDLLIVFRFYFSNSEDPAAPYKAQDVQLATVLSWRLTPAGLWVRGGFIELEDPSPYESIQKKLKLAIKAGRIGLTYITLKHLCEIDSNGVVHKMPLVAFSLYEKDFEDAQEPAGSASASQ